MREKLLVSKATVGNLCPYWCDAVVKTSLVSTVEKHLLPKVVMPMVYAGRKGVTFLPTTYSYKPEIR